MMWWRRKRVQLSDLVSGARKASVQERVAEIRFPTTKPLHEASFSSILFTNSLGHMSQLTAGQMLPIPGGTYGINNAAVSAIGSLGGRVTVTTT